MKTKLTKPERTGFFMMLQMETLWEILTKTKWAAAHIASLFLFCNIIVWSLAGFIVWFVIQFFSLRSAEWAVCFAGYAGYYIGLVGGIIFICRAERPEKERGKNHENIRIRFYGHIGEPENKTGISTDHFFE